MNPGFLHVCLNVTVFILFARVHLALAGRTAVFCILSEYLFLSVFCLQKVVFAVSPCCVCHVGKHVTFVLWSS